MHAQKKRRFLKGNWKKGVKNEQQQQQRENYSCEKMIGKHDHRHHMCMLLYDKKRAEKICYLS